MTGTQFYLAALCRLYILFVLVAAATGKVAAMRDFEETIDGLFRLPRRAVRAAAFAVVGAEALVALLLAAGGRRAWAGMAAALALFALFTAAILAALIQRRAISCNCFGDGGHLISGWDLVRNVALIAACAFYLRTGAFGPSIDPAAWSLLSGLALILFLVSTNLNEIALLARRA